MQDIQGKGEKMRLRWMSRKNGESSLPKRMHKERVEGTRSRG